MDRMPGLVSRRRRAALTPLALLATLAIAIAAISMAVMHPATPGAAEGETLAPVHATHAAEAPLGLTVDPCPGCDAGHEGALVACAVMLMMVALLGFARPRRLDAWSAPMRGIGSVPGAVRWRAAGPDLTALGISRT